MKNKYTTAEIADILGVSSRTIQRHLATLRDTLSHENKTFDYRVLYILETFFEYKNGDTQTTTDDNQATDENNTEYDRVEYFTEEEYQEFHKRLVEYPLLINQIKMLLDELDFHKKIINNHQEQQNKLIESIKERNFIEAKEKELDK